MPLCRIYGTTLAPKFEAGTVQFGQEEGYYKPFGMLLYHPDQQSGTKHYTHGKHYTAVTWDETCNHFCETDDVGLRGSQYGRMRHLREALNPDLSGQTWTNVIVYKLAVNQKTNSSPKCSAQKGAQKSTEIGRAS